MLRAETSLMHALRLGSLIYTRTINVRGLRPCGEARQGAYNEGILGCAIMMMMLMMS